MPIDALERYSSGQEHHIGTIEPSEHPVFLPGVYLLNGEKVRVFGYCHKYDIGGSIHMAPSSEFVKGSGISSDLESRSFLGAISTKGQFEYHEPFVKGGGNEVELIFRHRTDRF